MEYAEGRSPLSGSLRACPEPAEGVPLKYILGRKGLLSILLVYREPGPADVCGAVLLTPEEHQHLAGG